MQDLQKQGLFPWADVEKLLLEEQQKALVQAEPEPVTEVPTAVTPEKVVTACVEATEHAAEEAAEARRMLCQC